MHIQVFVKYVGIGIAVVAVSPACAGGAAPTNQFFGGIENRIREATHVIAGRARIAGEASRDVSGVRMVDVQIDAVRYLKGQEFGQSIRFRTTYSPMGFTVGAKGGDWGSEDEEGVRMVECFPYDLECSGIFFMRRAGDGTWRAFYAIRDDTRGASRSAVETIIEAEDRLEDAEPRSILIPLMSPEQPLLVRKYSVRAIMQHVKAWAERGGTILDGRSQVDRDETLFAYAMACVVSHLWREDALSGRAADGLDVVIALLGRSPTASSLDDCLQRVADLKAVFHAHPEKTKSLRGAVLLKRQKLTERASGLTSRDLAIMKGLGLEDAD
jgi:hypothetical protein